MITEEQVESLALEAGISEHDLPYFMAQMDHETAGFKFLHELGGPSYFAKYDGREDLGNTEPGDGYRFRGRGLIQLTGRHNYTKYGQLLGIDLVNNPELAAQIDIAVKVAVLYWETRVPAWARENGDVVAITRAINGGTNGLSDRLNLTSYYIEKYQDGE